MTVFPETLEDRCIHTYTQHTHTHTNTQANRQMYLEDFNVLFCEHFLHIYIKSLSSITYTCTCSQVQQKFLHIRFIYFYLCLCMYTTAWKCPEKTEENAGCPGPSVIGDCEPPRCGCWELRWGPLQEQQIHFTPQRTLRPQEFLLPCKSATLKLTPSLPSPGC